eukprot:CAMPEP_0182418764 /NCGR_PEP_ID=MMETSP1167-20130531/3145_1 /TAXON_ID=2988 /ORGANISM="Mallomonas Sp, Strain CCMP3275" /LENGTH=183 /DNA_ID=CAMNT_0024593143 /DNA_START=244 /DNA_END=795 /DNA_ORIENTATION=+
MSTGSVAEWKKKEGDSIAPGDAIADIETDKSTITYEAMDDAFIARILVEEGVDVPVGSPLMITVEDEEDVGKFADYKVEAVAPPPPPVPAEEPAQAAPAAVKEAPVTPAPAPVATPVPTTPAPPPPAVSTPAPPAPALSSSGGSISVVWGTGVSRTGLAAKLASDQQDYVKKYGGASNIPLNL